MQSLKGGGSEGGTCTTQVNPCTGGPECIPSWEGTCGCPPPKPILEGPSCGSNCEYCC